jgi:hypothetical protein
MVSLTIFWCLLGLYAKNLAYRLYNSSKFLEMVRLHAKVSQLPFHIFHFYFFIGVVLKNAKTKNIRKYLNAETVYPLLPRRKWASNCVVWYTSGETGMAWKRPCSASNLLDCVIIARALIILPFLIHAIYSDDIEGQCGLRFFPVDDYVRRRSQHFSLLLLVCWPRNVFNRYQNILLTATPKLEFLFRNSWHFAHSLPDSFHRLVRFLHLRHSVEFPCWHWYWAFLLVLFFKCYC